MSRFNTGNPLGSGSPLDLDDNAKNMDQAVNAPQDTFQDRLGKSRLTWAGIVKAGTGDAGVIVPIVQQAVHDVVAGVDGQVAVAQSAADRAETARDAAFVNADVYATVAEGRTATPPPGQFQVLSSNETEYIRYESYGNSSSREVGRFPSATAVAGKAELNETNAVMYAPAANIRVDTIAKTVTFSGNVRQGDRSRTLGNTVLDYSVYSGSSRQLIICDMATGGGLSLIPTNGRVPVGHALLGSILATTGELFGFPSGYLIDGDNAGNDSKANLIDVPAFFYAPKKNLLVDTIAKTVTFSGNVRQGDRSRTLSNRVLDYSTATGAARKLIVIDMTPNGELGLIGSTGSVPAGWALLGGIQINTGELQGFPSGYLLNGVDPNEIVDIPSRPPLVWDIAGYYQAPVLPGYIDGALDIIKSADINGWYDDLVGEYPEYITRNFLGNEATGLPVYEYRFSPPMAWEQSGTIRNVRVMIQSGIHPEPVSYVYSYHFLRLICEEWENSKHLEALRWGVEFSVIPALAPWNIDNNSRDNSNGVNINRNYPAGWALSSESGPAPLSELETQYSVGVFNDFKPDIFVDCHQFVSHPHNSFLWFPSRSDIYRMTARALVSLLARKWGAEHEWVPDASGLGRVSVGAQATAGAFGESQGAVAGTFEVCKHFYQEPGRPAGSPLTIRYATEAFANFILALLRGMS